MVGAELTKLLQSLATEYFTLGTSLCAEARNKAAARQTAYERLQEITEMSFTHQHVDNPSYSSLILMHSSPQLSQKTLSTLCQSMWKVPYCRRYFWLSRCYTNTVRASKHTIHREINTARQDFCNVVMSRLYSQLPAWLWLQKPLAEPQQKHSGRGLLRRKTADQSEQTGLF